MKRFACLWLPTFPIDRMRRARPASVPHDTPLALVEPDARGVHITAVNQAAAKGGIQSGQMLADARAVIPCLVTRPAEADHDASMLHQLALWLGRYGPHRNIEGADGLWVDITGVAHLFGGEAALAKDCVSRLRQAGFQAFIAIADTRSGAFALARYGRLTSQAIISPPGDMRNALADLPVASLQLTGDLVLLLRRLGLKRIGQLYHLPRAALTRRFREAAPRIAKNRRRSRGLGHMKPATVYAGWSEALVMRLDQALGELSEPQRGIVEPPVYRVHRVYAEPLISHDGIVTALEDLAQQLCKILDERDEGARTLSFAIYRADGSVAEIAVRTSSPAREMRHVVELFHTRLERIDAGLGIDAVVLEATRTERLSREQAGFAGADTVQTDDQQIGMLVDRLVNRLGSNAVFRLEDVSSHIPERAERRIPALHGKSAVAVAQEASIEKPLRPAFMLSPAEPITVIAEVPDGPPARFTWRRITRRVVRSEGPERIAPEWWRLIGKIVRQNSEIDECLSDHVPVPRASWRIRDYYRVEDEHGGVYWVYRAGLYPGEAIGTDTAVTDIAAKGDNLETGSQLATIAPPTWYLQGLF